MSRTTGISLLVIALLSACGGGGSKSKDKTRPSITIETPTTASTYVTGSTPVTLGGTAVDDKGVASVTWSNATTAGSGNATGTTTWTADVDLVVGDNDITVTATDVNGRTGSDSITVTLDTAPPIVTITAPTTAPTYQATATPVDLGGTATDDIAVVTVEWQNAATGGSGTAAGIGNWTATVDLATGLNSITVTATDLSGKTGTDRINVTRGIGEAWAWGLDGDGQLGVGVPPIRTTPQQVVDPSDLSGYLTGVAAVGGGRMHTLTGQVDLTARNWGWNGLGQLATGNTVDSSIPLQVTDPPDPSGFLTNVTAVTGGWWHSVYRHGDGTVSTVGANWDGQLGDGSFSARFRPVQVVDPGDPSGYLQNVTAIASGHSHTLALLSDQTVRAWGRNNRGQLGDTTTTDRENPIQVTEPTDPSGYLTGVMGIAALGEHSLAVKADGTVWAWGDNLDGQLGDGTTTTRREAVQVVDPGDPSGFLQNASSVAAGLSHSVAGMTDGTARAWGLNEDGQLGDGTTTDRLTPVQVADPSDPSGFLTNVIHVAATGQASLARISGDTLRAWGGNYYGECGDGTTTDRLTPVDVIIANVVEIAPGWHHVIARLGDGTAWTWGRDYAGAIGVDAPRTGPVAQQVLLTEVTLVSAGGDHTAVLRSDGTARTWGWNLVGQLGDGGRASAGSPVQVVDPPAFLSNVASIAAGTEHTLALLGDGTVRAWGGSLYSQLGVASFTPSLTPVQVLDPGAPSGFFEDGAAISAGGTHSVALKLDGTVWCWGNNGMGQIGDGTGTLAQTPAQVIHPADPTGFLTGIVEVSAGGDHTMALKGDGTVWTWGRNSQGQLGDGTNTQSLEPVQVIDPNDPTGFLTGIVSIAAGGNHCLALKPDGTVWAWGSNNNEQLGDIAAPSSSLEPLQVTDTNDPTGMLTDIVAIAGGGIHSIGLKGDGTVRCWGSNSDGQLGDPGFIASSRPIPVLDPTDPTGYLTAVVGISGGEFFTVALK